MPRVRIGQKRIWHGITYATEIALKFLEKSPGTETEVFPSVLISSVTGTKPVTTGGQQVSNGTVGITDLSLHLLDVLQSLALVLGHLAAFASAERVLYSRRHVSKVRESKGRTRRHNEIVVQNAMRNTYTENSQTIWMSARPGFPCTVWESVRWTNAAVRAPSRAVEPCAGRAGGAEQSVNGFGGAEQSVNGFGGKPPRRADKQRISGITTRRRRIPAPLRQRVPAPLGRSSTSPTDESPPPSCDRRTVWILYYIIISATTINISDGFLSVPTVVVGAGRNRCSVHVIIILSQIATTIKCIILTMVDITHHYYYYTMSARSFLWKKKTLPHETILGNNA